MDFSEILAGIVGCSVILGIGFSLLIFSFSLRSVVNAKVRARFSSGDNGNSQASSRNWVWLSVAVIVLMGGGISLVCYAVLLLIRDHTALFLQMFSDGGEGGQITTLITIVLGVIAIIMTLVTTSVIGISHHAAQQIREIERYHAEVEGHHKEINNHRDNIEDLTKNLSAQQKRLALQQYRSFLLYNNGVELENNSSGPGGCDSSKFIFRGQLQIFYARAPRAEGAPRKDLIIYLADHYDLSKHPDLWDEERIYLNMLEEYYQQFCGDTYGKELHQLFDKADRKIGFRSLQEQPEEGSKRS